MERNYNYIYTKLVDGENDLIGHIAYSIYKSNKIEYIEKFKKDHGGVSPTDEELKPFHDMSCTESSISLYKMKSESIVYDFIEEVQNGYKKDMEEDYIHKQNQHLESIIEPLKPKKGKQFFHSFIASLIGAFVFAIIVAAFNFIKSNNSNDASVMLGNSIEQMIEPQATSPNDSIQ